MEKKIFYHSYDNRPRGLQPARDRHVIASVSLRGRATFLPGGREGKEGEDGKKRKEGKEGKEGEEGKEGVPALHILPVLPGDGANYTCRVDFRIGGLLNRGQESIYNVDLKQEPVSCNWWTSG